jgi:large subunit ribosomal protein L21
MGLLIAPLPPPRGEGPYHGLVQSRAVPKADSSLSAVVVSGGKQYRVAPGDQILVDRLVAEPGSSIKLGRVLLLVDGSDIKVGTPGVEGVDVEAKVLAHRRGPRIESLRYKSKKRVRVHHGGRADLTAIQILSVGGLTEATGTQTKTETAPKTKAKPARGAAKPKAEAEAIAESKTEAPAKRAPRKPKTTKEPE